MKCPKCETENREGRKYCSKCGSLLQIICPACQAVNEPGEDFCGECGVALPVRATQKTVPGATSVPAASGTSPLPVAFANGRYQVKKFLGINF